MKQSDNSKLSHQNSIKSVRSESFSFTRPQDYINYGLEREKDKFNKSLRTMERISVIREAAKTQADMKRQKFEQQTRVISQNRSRKSEEFQKVVDNKVEHRKRILEKKYENRKKIDLEMLDYGNHLEKRMNKLSAWQKTEIRKKLKSKLEKFKQRMEEKQNRRSNEDKMDKEYDILAEKLLNEIKEKIDKRVNEYISLIGTRVQSARDHSLKVGHTFEKSIKIEGYHQRESLRKNVNKSLISSKKLKQKSLMASESSEKLKKTMYESFQKNRRGLSEISVEESRRLDKIEDRFKKKEEIFKGIRNSIKSKYEEKKQRNFMRTEKHFRNYIERQREEVRTM